MINEILLRFPDAEMCEDFSALKRAVDFNVGQINLLSSSRIDLGLVALYRATAVRNTGTCLGCEDRGFRINQVGQIERCDTCECFSTDEHAIDFVRKMIMHLHGRSEKQPEIKYPVRTSEEARRQHALNVLARAAHSTTI